MYITFAFKGVVKPSGMKNLNLLCCHFFKVSVTKGKIVTRVTIETITRQFYSPV